MFVPDLQYTRRVTCDAAALWSGTSEGLLFAEKLLETNRCCSLVIEIVVVICDRRSGNSIDKIAFFAHDHETLVGFQVQTNRQQTAQRSTQGPPYPRLLMD
jgi:hypothetical protein